MHVLPAKELCDEFLRLEHEFIAEEVFWWLDTDFEHMIEKLPK